MKTQSSIPDSASNSFIQKHSSAVIGIVSGFDRLRLRGTLRQLYCPRVMEAYLSVCHILIKDFGKWRISRPLGLKYYWSASETEYATMSCSKTRRVWLAFIPVSFIKSMNHGD